jgi:hypothetical protein
MGQGWAANLQRSSIQLGPTELLVHQQAAQMPRASACIGVIAAARQ